jgi:histidine triad (HIT) family protein
MTDCLFCRIIQKQIPAEILYEDDDVLAIHDITPQAPFHVLIMPKPHIESILEVAPFQQHLIGKIHQIAGCLAVESGMTDNGFRIVTNCGPDGGQSVNHLHFHVLGGRAMHWPPG